MIESQKWLPEIAIFDNKMFFRRTISDISVDSQIPDDRSSNSSDTEIEPQEARVYSHKNKSDSPKRSVGQLILNLCMLW